MPDPATLRDLIGGYALVAIMLAVLACAFVAIAWLFLAGFGDCPDPWAGCETVIGVVE